MLSAHGSRPETSIESLFTRFGKARSLKQHQILLPHTETNKSLYMVVKGTVRVTLSSDDDDGDGVINLCYLQAGDVFGEQCLFDGIPSHLSTVTYQARTAVELVSLPHKLVSERAVSTHQIYADLSAHINQRLSMATAKLAQILFMGMEQRIYACLLEIAGLREAMTHPDGMQIHLSRIELSQMAKCSRETAGRTLKVLHDKNLINLKGKVIVLNGVRLSMKPKPGSPLAIHRSDRAVSNKQTLGA